MKVIGGFAVGSQERSASTHSQSETLGHLSEEVVDVLFLVVNQIWKKTDFVQMRRRRHRQSQGVAHGLVEAWICTRSEKDAHQQLLSELL